MRVHIFFFVLVVGFLSCKTQDINNTQIKDSALNTIDLINTRGYDMQMKGIDFCATGIQPDWSLEMDFEQKIIFKSTKYKNAIEIPFNKLKEHDESGLNYHFLDDDVDLQLQINVSENPFSLGEDMKPYGVSVNIKTNSDSDFVNYIGQGEYYGNLILHDIWVLEKINGKDITEYQYTQNPYMEIHLENNRISGYLGCNTFGSSIYFGRNMVFINHLMSTKMACLNSNIENDFARVLRNKSFNYKVENRVLTLWNKSEELIFKKVD